MGGASGLRKEANVEVTKKNLLSAVRPAEAAVNGCKNTNTDLSAKIHTFTKYLSTTYMKWP